MYEYNKLKFCPKCKGRLVKKIEEGGKRLVCSKCGYIIYRNPYPVAIILIEKDGKILLAKRRFEPKKNYWALPGGFIEFNETPIETAKREAFEETGLKIKVKKILGIYLSKPTRDLHGVGSIFLAEILSGKLRPGSDVKKVKFFDPFKIPQKYAFKEQLKVIRAWRKNIKNR